MGKLRKLGKKIGSGIKSVGKKLKSGLGKVAKAFGKLGPLGSIALSFILPGIGSWISSVAQGSSFLAPIAQGLVKAGGIIKNGTAKVFNRVTDVIEHSMNAVSKPFMQEGARGAGSAFRDFVSDATGGFVDRSTEGLQESIRIGGETVTTGIDASNYDLSKNLKTGEFNNPADAKKIGKLQDEGQFRRKVDKFESKNIEGLTKKSTEEGFEWYKTGKDGNLLDKPFKTITDKSMLPTPIDNVMDKPSIFAEGDYENFKGRVKGSREFSAYKKIAPVQTYGSGIIQAENEAEAAEDFRKNQQSSYFASIGQTTLMGNYNPNQSSIDLNKPLNQADEYQLMNAYSGILS